MDKPRPLKMKGRFRTREDFPGTILFFDCGAAFILNETAKIIVEGIQREMTAEQIIVQIHREYPDTPIEQIEGDVTEFLAELKKCGAI